MTPPAGFDPTAEVHPNGESARLVEAWIGRLDDERLRIGYEEPDGRIVLLTVRADFLDEFMRAYAAARTREAAA